MNTAIILVNWHGADDTIACLESFLQVKEPHFVVIADNASTDGSPERIQQWLNENYSKGYVSSYKLVRLDANYGFAVGNNKALAVAMQYNPDYCMLLNNDTEVEPDFLKKLTDYAQANPNVKVLSPCICYYYDKNKIWFTGGKLTFATRKNVNITPFASELGSEPFAISYISGCALFFDTSVLNERYELLYNGFFFGEEDYEFSLRMKKQGIRMACVPASKVYHKVGASQKNTNDSRGLGRVYMYYHNRLICNRMYENKIVFYLICVLNGITCLKYFKRYTGSWKVAIKLFKQLMNDVRVKDGFDYNDFRSLMFDDNYFSFDIRG
ncbi:MAG: glycosyltransferase family 2 protein [Bacteroidales bacterium]|nr:glycosyltransferase family 2 protein [Bacteroidales bacterium]